MDYLPKKEDGKVSVSFRDDIPLELTAKRGHIEAARLLISSYRLNIDFQSWGGNTALHYASAWGEVPFMRFLLNMGAAVDPPGLATNTIFYLSLLLKFDVTIIVTIDYCYFVSDALSKYCSLSID